MAALRELFERKGCAAVRTYVQSGNVVFEHPSPDADALAAAIAAGPRESQAAAKRLLRGSFDHSLETQMELETLALSACANSADGKEGIAAFLGKRAPQFNR